MPRTLNRMREANRDTAQANRIRHCDVSGCPKFRSYTKRYCRWHAERNRRYGHPLGRMITRKVYQGYFPGVRRLIRQCPSETLAVIYQLLREILFPGPVSKSSRSRANLLRSELQRIAHVPRRDERALVIATSLFLLSHHNPYRLPDDERLTRMIGHGVLQLAPRPGHYHFRGDHWQSCGRPAGATATHTIGSKIREALSPWFLHCIRSYTSPTTTKKNKEFCPT